MEDQLISFEAAKLAKEKGFLQSKYPCFGDDGNIHTWAYFSISFPDAKSYYQSTQSLLQKWLREVHEMYVLVDFDSILFDVSIYGRYAPEEVKIVSFLSHEPTFYTYEQALETGLIEALKLIS